MSGKVDDELREDDILSVDEDVEAPPAYAQEFIDFIDYSVTAYHAADYCQQQLDKAGYIRLSEQESWSDVIHPGGKYYVGRNLSSLIAFAVGDQYVPGENGVAMVAAHIDALCWKVKPVSKDEKLGFERLAAAPYSGGGASLKFDGNHHTWWDRDLGLAGRVLVKSKGKVVQRLVNLAKPIARIPSLAHHFGAPALGPFNYETNMVPIIGMATPDDSVDEVPVPGAMSKQHSASILKRLSKELGVPVRDIVDFDLELYDIHPSTFLGLNDEFISSPRMDDKLCSFAALEALLAATSRPSFLSSTGSISLIGLFDTEEVGSGLRQGAKSNFLETVLERVVEAVAGEGAGSIQDLVGRTMARSFLASADVTHSLNPNFSEDYELTCAPVLNKGIALKYNPNARMTTTATSATVVRAIAEKAECEVQMFTNRNDFPSGGTVGPMLSERLGVPAADIGIPQMAMHSIRGLTGAKDPGLGVKWMEGLFRYWDEVERLVEFE